MPIPRESHSPGYLAGRSATVVDERLVGKPLQRENEGSGMNNELAAVSVLTDRYRMTVAEAMETEYPCGNQKGVLLRDVSMFSVRWLANISTTMKHKPEFRRAVRAARIVKEYRIQQTSRGKAKAVVSKGDAEEDAKHAKATCNSCGQTCRLGRHLFDRATLPRCYSCGGTMVMDAHAVDEFCKVADVAAAVGVSSDYVRQLWHSGAISGKKVRGRIHVSEDSLRHYLETEGMHKELSDLSGGEISRGTYCRLCDKTFRNYAAFKLHMREKHEDF